MEVDDDRNQTRGKGRMENCHNGPSRKVKFCNLVKLFAGNDIEVL